MANERHRSLSRPQHVDTCVVGAGYIGYPLALLLADAGQTVVACDSNPAVVDEINRSDPRYAPGGLGNIERVALSEGRLTAAAAPVSADTYVIAVPTPLRDDGRTADLRHVHDAVSSVASRLRTGNLVVIESTVPPGTTMDSIHEILSRESSIGDDLLLAYCPERLMPGNELNELVNNSRLIGGTSEAAIDAAISFYSTFVTGKLIGVDATTAELCKLFENTYRDVNIALANQLAEISELHGVDGRMALEMASLHPRVDFPNPGIGVGGHCVPVDPLFLLDPTHIDGSLIGVARQSNLSVEPAVAARVLKELEGINDPVVVLLGAAYKANVADIRESPALRIASQLRNLGVVVKIYDPLVGDFADSLEQLAVEADLLAILVPHDSLISELRVRQSDLITAMRRPKIVDFSTGHAKPWNPEPSA